MGKKTEQEKKSVEEQVIFLRIESEKIADEITLRNKELNDLVQEIAQKKEIFKKELEEFELEKKKLEEREKQVDISEANLNEKVESVEVQLKGLRKDIKDATKQLELSNNWVLEAKEEGEELKRNNSALALEIERRTQILSDIETLAQARTTLTQEVQKLQQELVEIARNCNDAVYFSKKQVEEENIKLALMKGELLRETTALHERLSERKRIEKDISIYISRARAVYSRSFPELEMKL